MKFHPTEDNAVIAVNANLDERTCRGTVLALGPGLHASDGTLIHPEFICPGIREGSSVLFLKHDADLLHLDGRQLFVVPVLRILTRVEEESSCATS